MGNHVAANILRVIEKFNQQLPPNQQLPISLDTPLWGQPGRLDSLGLVNLILLVEEQIFDELGIGITLADERALSQSQSPFRSVRSLADYVDLLIREKRNE